ncbi:hypothetical protein BABINDRAFT_117584 [Babjeviella inositovora NRRL Y-12698]|uniref:Monopolar spindle protein 2 n=1 Tax=Babjeviella inositovora NRRL Y-12698 TaxID=984486 RepID=A0A1E3QH82_9ASCO|nr:uncharacterized protein BABINDRAFT_117584 [Babjeviella inositovora NRRL Y-12698]ODQ76958.1 hypothetical protein BABINDRAFT_117584 [Babjeviella inositovora NRRL Y-12698]
MTMPHAPITLEELLTEAWSNLKLQPTIAGSPGDLQEDDSRLLLEQDQLYLGQFLLLIQEIERLLNAYLYRTTAAFLSDAARTQAQQLVNKYPSLIIDKSDFYTFFAKIAGVPFREYIELNGQESNSPLTTSTPLHNGSPNTQARLRRRIQQGRPPSPVFGLSKESFDIASQHNTAQDVAPAVPEVELSHLLFGSPSSDYRKRIPLRSGSNAVLLGLPTSPKADSDEYPHTGEYPQSQEEEPLLLGAASILEHENLRISAQVKRLEREKSEISAKYERLLENYEYLNQELQRLHPQNKSSVGDTIPRGTAELQAKLETATLERNHLELQLSRTQASQAAKDFSIKELTNQLTNFREKVVELETTVREYKAREPRITEVKVELVPKPVSDTAISAKFQQLCELVEEQDSLISKLCAEIRGNRKRAEKEPFQIFQNLETLHTLGRFVVVWLIYAAGMVLLFGAVFGMLSQWGIASILTNYLMRFEAIERIYWYFDDWKYWIRWSRKYNILVQLLERSTEAF